MTQDRDAHLIRPDAALLADCAVETYRASGPGGQHRNKTESAVRLTHRPTGVVATATERRSQHENRRRALARLRKAIALEVRSPSGALRPPEGSFAEMLRDPSWPRVSQRSAGYLVAAAHVLDRLEAAEGAVADVAAALGVSTASVVKFLSLDADLWQAANRIRRAFSRKPLR